MSLLINHSLMRYGSPKIEETAVIASNGGAPPTLIITFTRAPYVGELVILFAVGRTNSNPAAPSGFTELLSEIISGARLETYYRVCNGSESSSFTVTYSSQTNAKELIGYIISNYNITNIFATGVTKNDQNAIISPQNLISTATTLSVSRGSLVIMGIGIHSSFVNSSGFDNGFTIDEQSPSDNGTHSQSISKSLAYDDPSMQCVWTFGTTTNGYMVNTAVLNPIA